MFAFISIQKQNIITKLRIKKIWYEFFLDTNTKLKKTFVNNRKKFVFVFTVTKTNFIFHYAKPSLFLPFFVIYAKTFINF